MKKKRLPRRFIAERVRRLREERLWTQAELAKLLGLSQNRLSEIENGKGSFTAEQFLTILKKFNVPLDAFAVHGETGEADLQNALARLGAEGVGEYRETLPSERLKEFSDVAREILVSGQYPRLVPRLAAVLVFGGHANYGVLTKIREDMKEINLSHRLGWLLENTSAALNRIPPESLTARQLALFVPASHLLRVYLESARFPPWRGDTEDTFDVGAASDQTRVELRKRSSTISKKWKILTRIQPGDFEAALRESRE